MLEAGVEMRRVARFEPVGTAVGGDFQDSVDHVDQLLARMLMRRRCPALGRKFGQKPLESAAMGGEIDVTSEPDRGTRVAITLPRRLRRSVA